MELECVKEKLVSALSRAERAASKNTTLPVLATVLFVAQGKTLKVRSTNLEFGVEVEVAAKIKKEGTAAIPASVLVNTIGNMYGGETISMTTNNSAVTITTAGNTASIICLPPEDFPTLPPIRDGHTVKINTKDFIEGVEAVSYAAAQNDIKPELSGIFIFSEGDELYFVATDSFRLAEKKLRAVTLKGKEVPGVIIPARNGIEISRILEGIDGEISLSVQKSQLAVYGGGIYATTRTIEGVFPDYRQIIPKTKTTEVIVLKQDLANTLRLAHTFSDKFSRAELSVNPAKKQCEFSSNAQGIGGYRANMEGSLQGEPIRIAFNHRYLADCFPALLKESIEFLFLGDTKPIVVRGLGDSTFTYLLMPMSGVSGK